MSSTAVIGAQWGDEGKGKVIDIIAAKAAVVVRSQGGNNAGHTVVSHGETYKLHLIPSGILYKNTLCLVGAGVVLDPADFIGEIDNLSARGISFDNLRVDYRAHIIMPWHTLIDRLSEEHRPDNAKIGTTGRGIGPCYADKYERVGIRLYDLIHPDVFREKARTIGKLKNEIITKIYGGTPVDIDKTIAEYLALGEKLKGYAADVSVLVHEARKAGKTIMFEGAQATLLDIDWGTYPYVTSSHPVSAGVALGSGVGPNSVDEIIGVAKAYTTRVGAGPFPTELFDQTGETIRQNGFEFGTTTGRPRRTGWFDAVILRHSVRVNGLTSIAVNKLDTLSGIGDLKICTAYEKPDGSRLTEFPPTIEELAECKPIYETLTGFDDDIGACRTFEELPTACQAYIKRTEELCDCKISMVGVGPDREQIILRK